MIGESGPKEVKTPLLAKSVTKAEGPRQVRDREVVNKRLKSDGNLENA